LKAWYQLLSALDYLHAGAGAIIHHDIKAGNILLANNGRGLRLADFGEAFEAAPDGSFPSMHRSGETQEDVVGAGGSGVGGAHGDDAFGDRLLGPALVSAAPDVIRTAVSSDGHQVLPRARDLSIFAMGCPYLRWKGA
jgi:serine/threonine protein kinase